MNKTFVTSIFCGLITFLIVFSFVVGCSDDIVIEPAASLLGDYQGYFEYTENYGTTNEDTDRYKILLRFSDQNFWMWDNADSADAANGICICEPSGNYLLADDVEIETVVQGCATCVFNSDKLPNGTFSLRQPTDPNTGVDSIVMTQLIGDIGKEIRLVPSGN
jgi:hypothetical protein